jgi:DNA primase
MKIPEDKIQEVREATDILEVISQFVSLKKKGKSYMGLCPFHQEKTPSFSVDPVRGFYHCFGCGVGGNVFNFIMEIEKVGFPEALRSLADKAGISLPKFEKDDDLTKETEHLYYANQKAAEFFQQCLYETQAGKKALDYIIQRGFTLETLKAFLIGYAPNRWDGLIQKARRDSIPMDALQKAGLILSSKEGKGYYDRFRGRLMFPILNPSGRVVGFAGRILQVNKKEPKYINSPETPIYQKSRLLYGIYQSKTGIRRENRSLLSEGYTDVMRLIQEGFDYSVASSGTALTVEQARLVFRYSKNVILVFDGDSAGFSAALRGVDVLVEAGLNVEVAALPRGSDPDSLLKSKGKNFLTEILKKSQSFVDFRLDQLREQNQLETPDQKAQAARNLMETVGKIRDPLVRNLTIKDLAEKVGVDESLLHRQTPRQKNFSTHLEETQRKKPAIRESAEINILLLLLDDLEVWGKIIFQFVAPEEFQVPELRIIGRLLYRLFLQSKSFDSQTLFDQLSEDTRTSAVLTTLLSRGLEKEVDRYKLGFDCVLTIKRETIDEQINGIQESIRTAQANKEDVTQMSREWMQRKKKLQQTIEEIRERWKKEVEK